MGVEKMIKYNQLQTRADIVLYNSDGRPSMIVECKAPNVKINQDAKIADDIIFYAALGGILGSKLYYIFEQALYYSDYSNIEGLMLIFQGFYYLIVRPP